MRVDFIKMHGLGNDFVVLDARAHTLPPVSSNMASNLANRHTGIGCDQLVLLEPSDAADFRMRIFNADGGEVEACGNATRAVALLHGKDAQIETAGGLLSVSAAEGGASVDMGVPRFDWNAIPLAYAMDSMTMPVGWDMLDSPGAVNVGNPHVIFFVEDTDGVPLERLGPEIERDPLFPQRVNVNVATIESRTRIRLRVWERGAGLTLACGTGACATAVAAIVQKKVNSPVKVHMRGGELTVTWAPGEPIRMRGSATHVFKGEIDLEAFA